MLKVHPDGVIWVTNSSDVFPVDAKNGSAGQKFRNKKRKIAGTERIQCTLKNIVRSYFGTLEKSKDYTLFK